MNLYIDLDILICKCYFGQTTDRYTKFKNEWDYITENAKIIYDSLEKIIPICSGYSFRHFIDSSYKSNRKPDPELTEFKNDIIEQYGIYRDPLLEADDVLVLLSNDDDIIMTTDKDIRMLRNCIDFNFENNSIIGDGIEFKQIINGDRCDGVNPLMSDKASDCYVEEYFNGKWCLDSCILLMQQLGLDKNKLVDRFFLIKILEPYMVSDIHIDVLRVCVENKPDFKVSISILESAFKWMFNYLKQF